MGTLIDFIGLSTWKLLHDYRYLRIQEYPMHKESMRLGTRSLRGWGPTTFLETPHRPS